MGYLQIAKKQPYYLAPLELFRPCLFRGTYAKVPGRYRSKKTNLWDFFGAKSILESKIKKDSPEEFFGTFFLWIPAYPAGPTPTPTPHP